MKTYFFMHPGTHTVTIKTPMSFNKALLIMFRLKASKQFFFGINSRAAIKKKPNKLPELFDMNIIPIYAPPESFLLLLDPDDFKSIIPFVLNDLNAKFLEPPRS